MSGAGERSETGGGTALTPLALSSCPNCGNETPPGPFCGVCGAHLLFGSDRLAATRPHAYSAFPEEGVFKAAVVTTLFPHLSHRSTFAFRIALTVLVALLVAFALAGLEPAVIATSALGVPLLFGLYLHEVDVYEESPIVLGFVTLLAGTGLGIGFALLGGPLVANALQPTFGGIFSGARALEAAIAVPAVGQALMCVPAALAVPARRRMGETLDGFAIGAGGALGFTLAATLTNLVSLLSNGPISNASFTTITTEALVRGFSQPIVAAGTIGLVGAALWVRRSDRGSTGVRWSTSPVAAFALGLLLQIGLGFADEARLLDTVLLVVHLGAALLVLVSLRIGLHFLLLDEARDVRVGPAHVCPHCHHITPTMAFCPECGVATSATAKRHRFDLPRTLAGGGGDETARQAAPWPTVKGSSSQGVAFAGYPLATPLRSPDSHRHRRRVIVSSFVGGIAALVGALVVVAVIEHSAARPLVRCHVLCPEFAAEASGSPYVPSGYITTPLFSVIAPQLPSAYATPSLSKSASVIGVTYKSSSPLAIPYRGKQLHVSLGGGTIAFAAHTASSGTAEQWVDATLAKIAPNAVMEYQLPNAFVGYELGYGAVYDVQPNSTTGAGQDLRLLLMAAVRNRVVVLVLAEGPYDPGFAALPLLDHPAFDDFDVSLFLDSSINSVRWPNERFP